MATPAAALVTISFRRPGLQPPVFVAGSFSDPAWQPRQMQCLADGTGENHFTAQVSVRPGQEYRFKFKVGDSSDWLLDEHSSIATDEQGNKTNVLKVPMTGGTAGQLQPPLEATEKERGSSPHPGLRGTVGGTSAPAKSHLSKALHIDSSTQREGSRTPIEVVARTAAEVADTTARLDDPETAMPSGSGRQRDHGDAADDLESGLKTPLFAHESFGAYEVVDDGFDHETYDKAAKSPDSRPSLSDYGAGDVDIDDPTLERFPSDRSSVLDTLRKIQSGHDENRVHSEDFQSSRRTSVDSSDGSMGSLSPTSTRRRENRLSHSSFGHTRSAVSLGSIAEEPKTPASEGGTAQWAISAAKRRSRAKYEDARTPPTDEDEALMMRHGT
ncbi:Uncharacterized protein TPAR_05685 [Tolypocladium paradoxum]|uniref:AMP-activated protein kinase glycogen-binding domain-containing protein n=1 Tax=Tolypocladium paradoxum TaxID=94208 RepID=A0A2S4KV75_9HYPO|nr:Uncharacterized protein TPAR_05685 [Tolypocladium paradoxum]